MGRKAVVTAAPYPCDAGLIHRDFAIPTLLFGPRGAGAHNPDEYVEFDSVIETAQVLLAAALGQDQLPVPIDTAGQPLALIVEPLTEREREVLVLVSGMLNTAEVAEEMFISVNTVKTHLRNIYRKLAAAHRNEAVRRARQL